VPHNVEIADSAARTTKFLEGEPIDGVATVTYQAPELAAGSYYFLCSIHPNMNGTVQAMPETGPGPGATGEPGQSPGGGGLPSGDPPAGNPGAGGTPAPQASPQP
jgi:hypothetical protein